MNKIKESAVCNDEHDQKFETFKPLPHIRVYVAVDLLDKLSSSSLMVFLSENDAEEYISEQETPHYYEIFERRVS